MKKLVKTMLVTAMVVAGAGVALAEDTATGAPKIASEGYVTRVLSGKQDKLTQGNNIQISGNTISATDTNTTYTGDLPVKVDASTSKISLDTDKTAIPAATGTNAASQNKVPTSKAVRTELDKKMDKGNGVTASLDDAKLVKFNADGLITGSSKLAGGTDISVVADTNGDTTINAKVATSVQSGNTDLITSGAVHAGTAGKPIAAGTTTSLNNYKLVYGSTTDRTLYVDDQGTSPFTTLLNQSARGSNAAQAWTVGSYYAQVCVVEKAGEDPKCSWQLVMQ